ncbi:MAG: Uma2 family endonuclease [Prochlorothrix sp.]|nr:Uma2 family endonuclease [Prochlorothrix sp.]
MLATAPLPTAPITQTCTLTNISWPTYQALLRDMGDHRAARLSYTQGHLHIKMPSKLHELINRLLARLVTTLTEELNLEIVDLGSTTLQREDLAKGVEPDTCFYIQNAPQLQGVDPTIPPDLPPDLVIEVDITSPSTQRMDIYQQLGVPELWCYTQQQGLLIYHLQPSSTYTLVSHSPTFPFLSSEKINTLIQSRQTQPENTVIRTFRQWLQANPITGYLD